MAAVGLYADIEWLSPAPRQLFLEVPGQTKPIPQGILAEAQRLSIKIRDVEGKVY